MANELTGKQRLFVEAYLQCFNKTEAARRAGYKGDNVTLGAVGYENLKKPHIVELVEARIKEICMSTNEALAVLTVQAGFDPGPFLVLEDGKDPSINLGKLRDAGLMAAVKSIIPTAHGVKIEFESRQGAIDKILRAQGAYHDRVDITSGDKPISDIRTEILSALSSIATASAEKTDS